MPAGDSGGRERGVRRRPPEGSTHDSSGHLFLFRSLSLSRSQAIIACRRKLAFGWHERVVAAHCFYIFERRPAVSEKRSGPPSSLSFLISMSRDTFQQMRYIRGADMPVGAGLGGATSEDFQRNRREFTDPRKVMVKDARTALPGGLAAWSLEKHGFMWEPTPRPAAKW